MDYSVSVFCVIFRSKNKKFKKFVIGLMCSTTNKNPLAQPSGVLFVVEHVDEQKFLTKIFVRGLLRSNDPKVAVMPATAIPADYLI